MTANTDYAALIVALTGLVSAVGGIAVAIMQVRKLAVKVDGRLEQLLQVTSDLARKEGGEVARVAGEVKAADLAKSTLAQQN
jgi:hypothetical protein